MKYLLILFTGILLIGTATGQSLKSEKCKWQDTELKTYTDELSHKFVVAGLQSIHTGRKVTQLSQLTDKEVKKIKNAARGFKSCTVYVDFDHVMVNQKLNPNLSDADLSYMIVLESGSD